MNIRQALSETTALVASGNAVMLTSPSGIGKSHLMHQLFAKLKAEGATRGETWGFGQVFLATQTPPDLIGFQFKGEKEFLYPDGTTRRITVTDPSVPLWMISDEGKPANFYDRFFLSLDEYGQAEPDVKRAAAEILLNGGTSPWYLPQGSVRVGATNKGTRYGVTKDFDFAIARRTELNIQGSAQIWVEDFADKPYMYQGKVWQTMAVTKAWALTHPAELNEGEPKDQGPWCNPRSLCAADRYLQTKIALNGGKILTGNNDEDGVTMETLNGTIGAAAQGSLWQHLTFKLELPSYDKVIADPMGTDVPKKADMLMLMAYELAGLTQAQHLAPAIQYIQRMPKDMAVTYITALIRRDKNLVIEPAMQAWVSKNASLMAMLNTLAV